MSDEPLTNAAVEFMRIVDLSGNTLDLSSPPDETRRADSFADDVIFEDRRTGGMNFGTIEGRTAATSATGRLVRRRRP